MHVPFSKMDSFISTSHSAGKEIWVHKFDFNSSMFRNGGGICSGSQNSYENAHLRTTKTQTVHFNNPKLFDCPDFK